MTNLTNQLLAESRAMASYVAGRGLGVPPNVAEFLASAPDVVTQDGTAAPGGDETNARGGDGRIDAGRLADVHRELAALVAPAMPGVIVMLEENKHRRFGAIPLMRYLFIVTLISLAAFIGLSLSPYVSDATYGQIFSSSGLPLLVNELFYLSAAGIGASFWILMEVFRSLRQGIYDPTHDTTHWLRYLLGLIAGLILASLYAANDPSTGSPSDPISPLPSAMIALLGGFSATTVFKVLYRLISALDQDTVAENQVGRASVPALVQAPASQRTMPPEPQTTTEPQTPSEPQDDAQADSEPQNAAQASEPHNQSEPQNDEQAALVGVS